MSKPGAVFATINLEVLTTVLGGEDLRAQVDRFAADPSFFRQSNKGWAEPVESLQARCRGIARGKQAPVEVLRGFEQRLQQLPLDGR